MPMTLTSSIKQRLICNCALIRLFLSWNRNHGLKRMLISQGQATELERTTMWNTLDLRPGGFDSQRTKSWSPWLNSDNEDCKDFSVDSVPELDQKIEFSSSLDTKAKAGDGLITGDRQLAGEPNSKSSPEGSLHPEARDLSTIGVIELERTGLKSSSSGNFKSQDGYSAQVTSVSKPNGLIRAPLDPKPKNAGVSIAILSDPVRTSKWNASKHPKATGGEKETSFVPDLDRRKSHHYLAVVISWFFGADLIFLWNAILNAGDYFYSVFPEYHPSRVFPLLYIPVALVITYGFLVLSRAQHKIRWRVLCGFSIFFISGVFIILGLWVFSQFFRFFDPLVSAGNGTGSLGSRSKFIAISSIVILSSIGEGICGGGLLGEFSFMDPVYLQAFNAGLAASGIATTGLRMITKYIFSDSSEGLRNGAMSFFAISALVHVVGIVLYAFVFPNLEGVQKYRLKAVAEGSKTGRNSAGGHDFKPAEEELGRKEHSEKGEREWRKRELLYENWDYALDIVILYAVTFCIIPGFLYENTRSSNLGTWYPLLLLALFNGTDFLVRIVRIERLFMRSRRATGVCCSGLVLLFIPGFYFGARYPGAWLMMLLCGLLGTTNGYFTVCIFDNAPVGFKSPQQSTIGTLLYLATLVGIMIGLAADWFWQIH